MYIFWGVLGWSRLKDLDLYEDPGGPGVEQMEDSRGVVATEPLENIFPISFVFFSESVSKSVLISGLDLLCEMITDQEETCRRSQGLVCLVSRRCSRLRKNMLLSFKLVIVIISCLKEILYYWTQ